MLSVQSASSFVRRARSSSTSLANPLPLAPALLALQVEPPPPAWIGKLSSLESHSFNCALIERPFKRKWVRMTSSKGSGGSLRLSSIYISVQKGDGTGQWQQARTAVLTTIRLTLAESNQKIVKRPLSQMSGRRRTATRLRCPTVGCPARLIQIWFVAQDHGLNWYQHLHTYIQFNPKTCWEGTAQLACNNVDLPATQPGPDHVPSNERQTLPSCSIYSMDITGYGAAKNAYRIKIGVESVLSSVCLCTMLAQQTSTL